MAKSRTRRTKPSGRPRLRATPAPEARELLKELAATNGEQTAKVEKVLRKHGKAKVSGRQVGELNIGKYRLFPAQPKERQEALAASFQRHGIIMPVVADEQGNIIAGEFGYEYAKDHRIPYSVIIVRFACETEKWELSFALNMPTHQLDRTERESLIETYLKKDPQIAPKNLADLIGGMSKNKVAEIQRKLISDGEIPRYDKLRGHDGRCRPGKLPARIIANSPKEIEAALKVIPALPVSSNGKTIDVATATHFDFAALPELENDLTNILECIQNGKLSIPEALSLLERYLRDLPKHLQVRTGEGKRKNDYYTPAYALEPLLPFLPKDKTIWEPAWGKGHLASHLANAGYTVVGSEKMNFMTDIPPTHWDIAVTNIPFNDEDSKKHDFLARAYSLEKPFAFLMPGDALFGIKRVALYRQHGIQLIIPDKRINFFNERISADHSSAWFPTAWFCWGLSVPERLNFFEARW